jgi:hypothetical protein
MINEESVEKILQEADELNVKHEVITLSNKILESSPNMERFLAFELALSHFKNLFK